MGQAPPPSTPRSAALGAGATPPAAAPLRSALPAIERCFDHGTAEEIVAALEAEAAGRGEGGKPADPWAQETLATLRRLSPTAIKVRDRDRDRDADGDGDRSFGSLTD